MSGSISRRHLIILAGTGLAAAALPAALPLLDRERKTLADELLATLTDPARAAEIGRQWMVSTERGGGTSVYAQKIAKRLRSHGWHPGDATDITRAAIGARVRDEFRHDDMVEISGWQISRTEAELCALAAASLGTAPAEVEEPRAG